MKAKSRPKSVQRSHGQHILVVEDESDLQRLLRYNLEREGFRVSLCASGEEALERVFDETPDLVLLDLMLPTLDGISVCTELRRDPRSKGIPIIMLTAKGEESDIVVGLELGADDYVTKPFSPRVLLARIHAVIRRRAEGETADRTDDERVLQRGPLTLDPARHKAAVDGEAIELTHSEFKILQLLARRAGRVFTRQQVIEHVHGSMAAVTDRSVDVMIVAMRRKMREHGQWIETVRGVGYRFKE